MTTTFQQQQQQQLQGDNDEKRGREWADERMRERQIVTIVRAK